MSIINSPIITSCRSTTEDIETTYMNELNALDFVFAIVDYKGCPEYGNYNKWNKYLVKLKYYSSALWKLMYKRHNQVANKARD